MGFIGSVVVQMLWLKTLKNSSYLMCVTFHVAFIDVHQHIPILSVFTCPYLSLSATQRNRLDLFIQQIHKKHRT